MSKGTVLGLVACLSAWGCGSSSNPAGPGGPGVGGRGGGSVPTTGNRPSTPTGAGGAVGVPIPTGVAGSGPSPAGASGTSVGAGGATGTSTGTAGVGAPTGAAGATGTGGAGTGGGAACADPLTHCAGTMSGSWCMETVTPPPQEGWRGLWANRPDDVWLVGGDDSMGITPQGTGAYAHFDGCAWTVTPRPDLAILLDVWGASSNDVWFVGARGSAYHWDGSALTAFPLPGATVLLSVSGTSSGDVWAVGSNGIFHYNGSAWSQSSPATGNDVWAVAPNDVWVASGSADVLHFDGTTWTATPLTFFGLFTVWGDGTQAYAAGEGEALFHFAGGSWKTLQVEGGSSQGFTDIGGLGADIFAPGNSEIFRLSGDTFAPLPDQPPGGRYFKSWVSPTQIWFGTLNGTVAHRSR